MSLLSQKLAPVGSTGNNTHTGVPVDDAYEAVAFLFNITAIGATPTVTYKFQGSLDGLTWYDVFYITDATDTPSAATRAGTTVSQTVQWMSSTGPRKYTQFRCVTTANTNVTYNADVITFDADQ
jgi:hypothetical protein